MKDAKYHDALKKLGRKCADIRKEFNFTQRDFATFLGCSPSLIAAFETGRTDNVLLYIEYVKLFSQYNSLDFSERWRV